MVSRPITALYWICSLVAAAPAEPVLERLDPPRRAAVVMALLALVLTGLLLVTCVMLGAHWVRRMARHKPTSPQTVTRNAPSNQRLRDALESILPTANTGDTIHSDASTKDTKIDR